MQFFVVFGLCTALAWGVYVFLLKLATTRENRNNDPAKVFLAMTGGIFLVFLLFFLATNRFETGVQFSFSNLGLSLCSGGLWAIGNICILLALSDPQTPLAKIVPLYNTNTLIVVLLGIVLLNEAVQNPLFLTIGTILVVLGSLVITWKDDGKSKRTSVPEGTSHAVLAQGTERVSKSRPKKWIVYGVIAAFSLSGYALILKIAASAKSAVDDPFLVNLEQSLGILLVAMIFLISRRNKSVALSKSGLLFSISSGVLWALGGVALLIAIHRYAAPISNLVPIYNTNTLVAVILGLVVLREVPAQRLYVILGALLIVTGGIFVMIT